jgi:predicted metal-dependent hydrolase
MDTEIPEEFWQGIEQFNQGDFYACHDTLEAIWIEAPVVDKRFYQGILQIAVGLYHLGNHNWRGAVILMGEGLNRLGDYQPEYGGIEVEQFIEDASELLSEIQTAGQDRVDQIVLTDHPPLESTDKNFLRPPIIQKITAKG